MGSIMMENWGRSDLQLTDFDGNQIAFKYSDILKFNQRREALFSSDNYVTGMQKVVTFYTAKGEYRIPRTPNNDTAILDMMLSRPKVYN